jgi:hypothetical protein
MSTPFDKAIKITGWAPSVVSYLYDEFVENNGEDFLDYLGEQVAIAAFVIGASNGLDVSTCLQAYAHGFESVVNEDFSVDEAIDSILYNEDECDSDEE